MKINLSAVTPRILESRGTPSKFVLYALKDMYAKFGAFTRFAMIFVNFDANGLDSMQMTTRASACSFGVLSQQRYCKLISMVL